MTIIGAKSTAQHGLQLNEATFIQIDRSGEIVDRIDARQATLGDGVWRARRRRAQARAAERPNGSTRLEVKTSLRPEFVEEKLARPETIPFFDLPSKMQAAWSFGLNANGFGMQFHSLIALPMLMVAMTLIAATVSMRFARMGQSATMILGGVVAGFLLYVVSVLVKAFGTAGIVPPVRCCMDSGCGCDVFRGDVPFVQGRRLVAVVPVEGRKRSILARLVGATALACVFARCRNRRRLGAGHRASWRAEVPGRFADAARGRHAHLRQRQRDRDRGRRRADRLWRQPAGRPARRLQPQDRTRWWPAAMSRSSTAPAPRSIPTRSTSPTISPTASSTRCASRRSTRPISPPKAPSATPARSRPSTTASTPPASPARKSRTGRRSGASRRRRSSGTARRRPSASSIRASSSSACRSPTSRCSKWPTRRSSARPAS